MDKRLERILPRVQKPARYVGGEYNAVMKDLSQVDTRVAFCFPDTYEIGMSNLGMRILYGIMNNMEGVWCERVFAPWGDMEEEMRRAGLPLYALESGDPIRDFDIIAFSVGYEMAFPAMLNMLDLAGVPLHASERTELTPLVIAGGTAMFALLALAGDVGCGSGPSLVGWLSDLCGGALKAGLIGAILFPLLALVCALLWRVTGHATAMIIGAMVVMVIRALSVTFHWNLPRAD